MNTDASYERTDRTVAELRDPTNPPVNPAVNPAANSSAEVSPFALHDDPSQTSAPEASAPTPSSRSIAWVRPSELPTTVGAPWLRRGADLHAEIARRARHAPAAATTRAGRRITRTAIGRPQPMAPTTEGLGL